MLSQALGLTDLIKEGPKVSLKTLKLFLTQHMVEISFLKPFSWVSTSVCVGFLLRGWHFSRK